MKGGQIRVPIEGTIGERSSGPALPESVAQPSSMIVSVDGAARQVLDQAQTRLLVVGALFALALLVVAVRLADLAIFGDPAATARAHVAPPPAQMVRADILDRNGRVLATSIPTASLVVDRTHIIDASDAALQLSKVFPDAGYGEFLQRMQGKERFVYLRRHLTPPQQYAVNQLGIPGLEFHPDERRFYPQGNEAAHLIGYADADSHGRSGIEKQFDELLAAGTEPLRLSIDMRLQHIVHREVQAQIDAFQAKGGGGLIMDTRTGEILAIVSLPDFDPQDPAAAPAPEPGESGPLFNRMLGAYEMGSIFKVFNTALALDSGKVKVTDYFDAFHPIKIGRFTIHDFKGDELPGYSSVAKIFQISSNIGSVQIVKQVGREAQRRFMVKLDLTQKMSLEMPVREIERPKFDPVWQEVNMMTIAFGHGISVTPVQLVSGISAVANGGILHTATLLAHPEGYSPPGTRVISEETSDTMRRLMRLVVTGGTAKQFGNVPGYLVGGKTGTAEKITRGGAYAKKHANLSSFVGVFPMTDPRYAVFVTIDEPRGNKKSAGYETGGWVAAPAVSRVIAAMGPMLGVPPVDAESPIVQAKMEIEVNPSGRRVAPN